MALPMLSLSRLGVVSGHNGLLCQYLQGLRVRNSYKAVPGLSQHMHVQTSWSQGVPAPQRHVAASACTPEARGRPMTSSLSQQVPPSCSGPFQRSVERSRLTKRQSSFAFSPISAWLVTFLPAGSAVSCLWE